MSGQGTDPLVTQLFEEYCKTEDPDVMDLMRRCNTMDQEDELSDLIADFLGLRPTPHSPALIKLDLVDIINQAKLLEAAGRREELALALNFLS